MPFLKTISVGLGGVLATVAIYSTGIIGANYPSGILTHLLDIVNGSQTRTVIATNAPNWATGTQISQIVNVTASVATGGTLASSTAFSFAVAAIDVNGGTTTLSTPVSASVPLYSSTSSINVIWPSVRGAIGYAVFTATGTVSTAGGFSQYFYATSTNATTTKFTMTTTTGSLAGNFTSSDGTAFSTFVDPQGPSFIEGNGFLSATSSPIATSTSLQLNGAIRAYSSATSTCAANNDGAIFYHSRDKHLYVCEVGTWQIIK